MALGFFAINTGADSRGIYIRDALNVAVPPIINAFSTYIKIAAINYEYWLMFPVRLLIKMRNTGL